MKILLAGGGTGGHLFPAVAIAQRHLELDPKGEVLFVGTERGIEAKVLPQLGLPLKTIDIRGFVGKGVAAKARIAPLFVKSVIQSIGILKEFTPDVVVGVGGYASAPALVAAKIKGIPFVIHEQNAAPGLTNRLLAPWASRVCLAMSDADRAFHHGRTVLTGNPLRRGMDDCPPIPEGKPRLLVFGGSRGARAINEAMVAALPLLEDIRDRIEIIHQTGTDDLEQVQAGYREAGWEVAEVVPFIQEMSSAYAKAHLVLSRSGATTIAELTACARPAILVPYPFAAGDHQTANAAALARKGAALMLPQSELTPERLARLLADLLADRRRLLSMGGVAGSMGIKGAVDRVLRECENVVVTSVPERISE